MTKLMTVEGMMCGMCESHVNDALRKVPGVKKAAADRSKNQVKIVCDDSVSDEVLIQAVQATGYDASNVRAAEEESGAKRGLLHKKS